MQHRGSNDRAFVFFSSSLSFHLRIPIRFKFTPETILVFIFSTFNTHLSIIRYFALFISTQKPNHSITSYMSIWKWNGLLVIATDQWKNRSKFEHLSIRQISRSIDKVKQTHRDNGRKREWNRKRGRRSEDENKNQNRSKRERNRKEKRKKN